MVSSFALAHAVYWFIVLYTIWVNLSLCISFLHHVIYTTHRWCDIIYIMWRIAEFVDLFLTPGLATTTWATLPKKIKQLMNSLLNLCFKKTRYFIP